MIGETIDVYVVESDGTDEDGGVGAVDAAVLEDVFANLHHIGSVHVQVAAADVDMRASFPFRMTSRYYSIAVWNATADSLKNTAGVNKVVVTPIPPEGQ